MSENINNIVADVEKKIVETLNNAELPTFAMRLILRGILLEIDNIELRNTLVQKENDEE
jgi:hypothetical protein